MKRIDRTALYLTCLLFGPLINYYLNTILQYGFGIQSVSAIVYVILALIGIFSYKYILFGRNRGSVGVVILLALGFFIAWAIGGASLIITNDFNPIESPLLMVFLYCVPVFILARECGKYDLLLKYMYYASIINLILFLPGYYFAQQYLSALRVDYMPMSYNVLLAFCTCLSYSWEYKKILSAILAIASLILLVVVGSRGASLSAILYVLLLFMTKFSGGEKKKAIIIGIVCIILAFLVSGALTDKLSSLINSGDLYSRNLKLLEGNAFLVHDSRIEIRDIIYQGISENPFGYGLLGDRIIMQLHNFKGVYAHNIILEFIADFGIIIGPFLFLAILYKLASSLKKPNSTYRDLLFILIPAGFIKLFFSGSYLVCPEFYFMISLLFIKQSTTRSRNNIITNQIIQNS